MPAFRKIAPVRRSGGPYNHHIPVTYDNATDLQTPNRRVKNEIDPFKPSLPLSLPPPLISPLTDDFATAAYVDKHDSSPSSPLSYNGLSDDNLFVPAIPSTTPRKKTHHGPKRAPGHVPRPLNPFILFRSKFAASRKLASQTEINQNELSKEAGRAWNAMSKEEQLPFQEEAKIRQMAHKVAHPNYSYSPTGSKKGSKSPKRTSKKPKTKKQPALKVDEEVSSPSSDTTSYTSPSPVPAYPYAAPIRAAQGVPNLVPDQSAGTFGAVQVNANQFQNFTDAFSALNLLNAFNASAPTDATMFPMMNFGNYQGVAQPPPSPFHPHIDSMTGQYAYPQYAPDSMATSMPTLPHFSSAAATSMDPFNCVVDMPAVQSSNTSLDSTLPSALFSENFDPSADFMTMFNFAIGDGQLEVEGAESAVQQSTADRAMQAEPSSSSTADSVLNTQMEQDAFGQQFFKFDMWA